LQKNTLKQGDAYEDVFPPDLEYDTSLSKEDGSDYLDRSKLLNLDGSSKVLMYLCPCAQHPAKESHQQCSLNYCSYCYGQRKPPDQNGGRRSRAKNTLTQIKCDGSASSHKGGLHLMKEWQNNWCEEKHLANNKPWLKKCCGCKGLWYR